MRSAFTVEVSASLLRFARIWPRKGLDSSGRITGPVLTGGRFLGRTGQKE